MLINLVRDYKREDKIDKFNFYLGEVIDNEDPKKLERVRVRIKEIHGTSNQIPNKEIPFAVKCQENFLGKKSKKYCVPDIGTIVKVVFHKGDIYSPIYTGEISNLGNKDSEQESLSNGDLLIKDKNGNKWKKTSNKLEIEQNGDINLKISSDFSQTIGGKLNIKVDGDSKIESIKLSIKSGTTIEIEGTTSISIKSPSINFDGNATISGNLQVVGNTTTANMTATNATISGKPFLTHTHAGVTPGPGTSGPVSP